MKAIGSAAALALAAALYMAPAGAVSILCEDPNQNHMLVDSSIVQSCIDAGVGNIGNGQNDDFLNAGNTGWTDITSQFTSSFTQSQGANTTTGTFSFDSSIWNTYGEIAIGFKFGTGNQPDEWFVYLLQDLVSSGDWTFVNVFGKGGGLSHLTFYAGEGTTTVPEPATLTLLGLGLLSLGFVRRKKAK
jgi:hypothetical protein